MKIAWRDFFTDKVVLVIFGSILAAALGILFDVSANQSIGVFALLVSLSVIYAMIVLEFTRKEIDAKLGQLGLVSFWMYSPSESDQSYQKISEIVRSAKKSIHIVSIDTSSAISIDRPEPRKNYLEALEKVIRDHLNSPTDQGFTYVRLIQSSHVKDSKGDLQKSFMGDDEQTFNHCREVLELKKQSNARNVIIEFRLIHPAPSFPSILIVDEKYIAFALVSRASGSDPKMTFTGELVIEDRDGKTAANFKSIFDRLSSYPDAVVIKEVVD